ncbi:MAG TPA: hypothetical protein VFQ40_00545 [Actinomycetota bacterium]|nr:hypothetical protein [Actinomycetota bacterium]
MAIKGKGRTRARQPVRAPRRGPVEVKPPFALRRGVQAVAAFVAGLLVFWGGVWLTNGLRAQDADERERTEALRRRQAGSAWNQLVNTELGAIGVVQEGRPPQILPELRATITDLAGDRPPDATEDLQTAASDAREVGDAIEGYAMAASLRDKGFDRAGVLRFLSAQDELVTAIELYRQAALLGVTAIDLQGDARDRVLDRAVSILNEADDAVADFYLDHTEAMASAGIVQQPTLPGS